MERKQLKTIDIPMLETTKEGKLKGGFTAIGKSGINLFGGSNDACGNNDVCSDNGSCYNNSNSQLCAGNRVSTDCSSHHLSPTSTSSTSTSSTTSLSNRMTDIFSLFY